MPEAGSLPNNETEETEEKKQVSRIVIEFAGMGMADVAKAHFENISVGQMLAFAKWADWQADRAVFKMEMQRQAETERKAQFDKIIVPRGRLH